MRHQLKPKTPSARARMNYILRAGRYGVNQSRVDELVVAGVANLPAWASGPEDFWAGTDGFERANARLCLELELNLPRELSREGQVAAVGAYIDRLTAEAGAFPITWGIHDDGGKNLHCHLMLQERPLDGLERGGPKAHFKRANKKKPANGGVAKSEWWHDRKHVFWSRALWADACNQQLLAEGHVARLDPRRKSERLDEALRAGDLRAAAALCTQTERHEGVKVGAARKKLEGGWIEADDLPEQVTQIINGNDQARSFNCWLRDWSRAASEKELSLFLADHLHDLKQRLEAESPSGHIQVRAAWMGQQHAEALIEDAERDAELAELMQVEQSAQAADLGLAGAVQAAHIEALDEDAVRTRLHRILASHMAKAWNEGALDRAVGQEILDNLGPGVPDLQGAVERVRGLRVAHAEALAEDEARTRYLRQITVLVGQGQKDGWAEEAELLRAIAPGAALEELEDIIGDLNERAGFHSWQQYQRRISAESAPVESDADVHEDTPEWFEQLSDDGLLGWYADTPDEVYLYDEQAATWVEHDPDPDHRPNSGPRM